MDRRAFLLGPAALGAGAAWSAPVRRPTEYGGVEVGIQSFCFNDLVLDDMLDAVEKSGFGAVELYSGHVEPRELRANRGLLRDWRMNVDLAHFRRVREKFDSRALVLRAYNISPRKDWTDREIDRAFQMTRAMGVSLITASSNVSTAARLSDMADRYRIRVAFHNHSNIKEDEFATAADYDRALNGRSKRLGINLDIGHFGAAGQSPLEFLEQRYKQIFILHVKDRKKDQGPQVFLGEGDSQVKEVLLKIRENKWPIPAYLEHVYKDGDRTAAMKKNLEWMKGVLEGG